MGVELRRGYLNLQADARIAKHTTAMSAVGWDHDFQSVVGTLHLPPGWRLFAATGVDTVSDSWLMQWTLLDFFLVLIITLSLFKLRSWKWAFVGFSALVLIFHEPGAPRWVWLYIIAVLALQPVLPKGWVKRVVQLWGSGAMIVLLLITIPFVVNQIRWGIYPQLAPAAGKGVVPYVGDKAESALSNTSLLTEARVAPVAPVEESTVSDARRKFKRSKLGSPKEKAQPMIQEQQVVLQQQDPNAIIPTGPGLPRWQWQTIDLRWSGPVTKTQQYRLYLLSPVVNLVLTLLRVFLLLMMIWSLLDWRRYWRQWGDRLGIVASVILLMICAGVLLPRGARADEVSFPSADLLQELRRRLLEKPDCFPQCADISQFGTARPRK